MIISHKHKFIFIKTKKTAGTSVEIALSKICGKNDILTPISPNDEIFRKEYANISAQNFLIPLNRYLFSDYIQLFKGRRIKKFYNHMPSNDIKKYLSEKEWNSYYKFSIERNPYDRAVSLYFWRGADKKYSSVYEFLKKDTKGSHAFMNQKIYTINDQIILDKLYQYEDLGFLLRDLTTKLQLKEKLQMPNYKAKSNTRKIRDYKAVLDEKAIKLISEMSKELIKLFDYKF